MMQPIPRITGCTTPLLGLGARLACELYLPIVYLLSCFTRIYGSAGGGRYNFIVTGTPTKIPCDCLCDLIAGRICFLIQQHRGGHDTARCAVSALHRAVLDERFLDGVSAIPHS